MALGPQIWSELEGMCPTCPPDAHNTNNRCRLRGISVRVAYNDASQNLPLLLFTLLPLFIKPLSPATKQKHQKSLNDGLPPSQITK